MWMWDGGDGAMYWDLELVLSFASMVHLTD